MVGHGLHRHVGSHVGLLSFGHILRVCVSSVLARILFERRDRNLVGGVVAADDPDRLLVGGVGLDSRRHPDKRRFFRRLPDPPRRFDTRKVKGMLLFPMLGLYILFQEFQMG